jgi:hypothetical protein
MIIETIGLVASGGGVIAVLSAFHLVRNAKRELAIEQMANRGLESLLKQRAQRIAELEGEVAKWAKTRSAMARAGGLALGIKRRQAAEEKRRRQQEARANTVASLSTANLRPRDEVVAGARENRRSLKSSGAVAS